MDSLLLAFVLLLVLIAVGIFVSDCDLTLAYADKCGNKLANLRGKVIWITGASSGIGAATAVEAAQLGARVVLSARSRDKLQEIQRRCLEAGRRHGRTEEDILVLPMDVTELETHVGRYNEMVRRLGKLDIMFHNAGQSQRANWERIDLQVDRDMFELNVFSVVHLTRVILPQMISNGGGAIAVMSSAAGKVGTPFSGTYTATKGPSINDVTQNFHIFGPPPPLSLSHSRNLSALFGLPPLMRDIIYGWSPSTPCTDTLSL